MNVKKFLRGLNTSEKAWRNHSEPEIKSRELRELEISLNEFGTSPTVLSEC